MNVQFSGGSAKQQRWVQDAIADCTYPLGDLGNITITFTWADQLPPSDTGKQHAYMVTTRQGLGVFLVTIVSWADDPTNPNNQGLPNPSQDIYDFFKASVVHELGHVVTFSTFDTDDLNADVALACSLFWTPNTSDGSARRYGKQSDWDSAPLTWEQEIREAVAEVFKCAFYSGRQVFLNRTQWTIDENAWTTLLSLMPRPVTGPLEPVTYVFDGSYLVPSVVNGVATDPHVSIAGGSSFTVETGEALIYPKAMPLAFDLLWQSTIKISSLGIRDIGGGNSVLLPPGMGFGDLAGDHLNPPPSLFGSWSGASSVGDAFPYWQRAWMSGAGVVHLETWDTDPDLGGTPTASRTFSNASTPAQPVPILDLWAADADGDPTVSGVVQIDEWKVHTFAPAPPPPGPSAPYPLPAEGDIQISPALRGAVRLG